ncbi:interleukin-18-binding protein [Corvus kubaryi]|uniref:interleukin-18-binding protein n=1 Tax=Corvus kubaryi TaxID=68294 RepID=UPI001C04BA39|nr:interleukin-18-binding protein [Corvus kubaryi]
MDRSGGQTALRSTSRDLRDPGRRMLGGTGASQTRGVLGGCEGPLGAPAWILLLCWGLAARCTGAMALPPPSITILRMPAEPPHPGESVTVSCEALSGLPELTLLYWLENGSFVESLHPDGAVREGTVQEALEGSGLALHRDLHFSSFNTQHLHTNFTCVVLSPLGVDTREVSIMKMASQLKGRLPVFQRKVEVEQLTRIDWWHWYAPVDTVAPKKVGAMSNTISLMRWRSCWCGGLPAARVLASSCSIRVDAPSGQSHPEGSPQMPRCCEQGSNWLLKWLQRCGSRSKVSSGRVAGPGRGC